MTEHEWQWCPCGFDLRTPYERRQGECAECERLNERMHCGVCGDWVGVAYTDGRTTFCSGECERLYWDDAPLASERDGGQG